MEVVPAEAAQVVAVISSLGALIAVVIKGYLDWRKDRDTAALKKAEIDVAGCHEEDDRADRSYKDQIKALREDLKTQRAEMAEMRREMDALRAEHLNCEKKQATLQTEIDFLRRQLNAVKSDV